MYNIATIHRVKRNNKEMLAYKIGTTLYYKDTEILDLSNKVIGNDPDRPDNFIYFNKSHNFNFFIKRTWRGCAPMLRVLKLTSNNLFRLPGSIRKQIKLKKLHLGYNNLTSLPEWIGELKNLELLILTGNQLTSLPLNICKLTQLKNLGLSGNMIESIPSTFKKLRPDLKINYNRKEYTRDKFMELFEIVEVSSNNSNNNSNNKKLNNKPALRNIESLLINNYENINKFNRTVNIIKNNLPPNVSKADVNNVVSRIKMSRLRERKIKKYLLNIHANNFNRSVKMIINNHPYKSKGGVNRIVRYIKHSRLENIEKKLRKTTSNNFNKTFNIIIKNLPYLPPVSKEDVNRIVSEIKSFRLRKIESRLMKTPVNNFSRTVKMIKSSLHATVSKEDVNNIVRSMNP